MKVDYLIGLMFANEYEMYQQCQEYIQSFDQSDEELIPNLAIYMKDLFLDYCAENSTGNLWLSDILYATLEKVDWLTIAFDFVME